MTTPRFRRLSFNRGGLAPGGKEFSASRLDRGLGFWNVILQIRFLVRHIDFDDLVDRWLGLSVKALNRDRAKSEAREHRKTQQSIGLSWLSSLIVARIVACANARDRW